MLEYCQLEDFIVVNVRNPQGGVTISLQDEIGIL